LLLFLFIICAAWFWLTPEKSFSPARPLRRLIAYGRLDLIIPWNGKIPQFHGYNVSDTITARVMFSNANVDGMIHSGVREVFAKTLTASPLVSAEQTYLMGDCLLNDVAA
jgi:hypothetical protein